MRSFFPIIFSAILILFFGFIDILLLRLLNRDWWSRLVVRRVAWLLPPIGLVSLSLWGLGDYHSIDGLALVGAMIALLVFVVELFLVLSLPFSGVLHFVDRIFNRLRMRRRRAADREPDSGRRRLLKTAAAAVPAVAVATGLGGVARAFGGARVYLRTMEIPGLPAELDGIRVLHLSDLHLRQYVTLDDLEYVLERARPFSPHIVAMVGDISDDLGQLPSALSMAAGLRPPLGTYAVLGNHEYFQGVGRVRRIFDSSPVPLLVNESTAVEGTGSVLRITGVDDPRRMTSDYGEFFTRCLDAALPEEDDGSFTLLLSHRPSAFPLAADRSIGLTLAGHTHGVQIGFAGRSLFEPLVPENFLWGHYVRDGSHLYTSSGMGHWFPVRLGCPPEAPVLELRQAGSRA